MFPLAPRLAVASRALRTARFRAGSPVAIVGPTFPTVTRPSVRPPSRSICDHIASNSDFLAILLIRSLSTTFDGLFPFLLILPVQQQ